MTFVLQNIYPSKLFVFKEKICFYVLMSGYNLSAEFKRQTVFDAMYAMSNRNMSAEEWRRESLFYWSEASLPGVVRYVDCVADSLGGIGCVVDPRDSEGLVVQILEEVDGRLDKSGVVA